MVLIPAFAGTNCEYDTARAFEKAGALTRTFIVRNLSVEDIEWSFGELARLIDKCNILAIPGGFSGGDEPEARANSSRLSLEIPPSSRPIGTAGQPRRA
jgi:phosphoribosylformylglycinamidine synthase